MKHNKKYNKSLTIAVFIILGVSMTALTGCNAKKQVITLSDNTGSTLEQSTDLNTTESTAAPQDNSEDNTADSSKENGNTINSNTTTMAENTAEETGDTNTNSGEENYLDKLVTLLGLTKEEISKEIGEEPTKIDEGGLEFEDYGIRVWFDADSKVNQIFLLKEGIDLNGVKTGDKISAFKEVFGDPIKDNNGDAHFKYGDVFISVNYEKDTSKTYGLYILSEDF
jgi:hypothetical protein